MSVINFKVDNRISPAHRLALKEFCKELGGDVAEFANRLGVKVFAEILEANESGYLVYDEACGSESGYKIVVNSQQTVARQKFTVAHELGHFVLHRESPHFKASERKGAQIFEFPSGYRTNDFWNRREYPQFLEVEADQFAVNLLLPMKQLKKQPEFISGEPAKLASRLGLSPSFVAIRFGEALN